MIFLERYFAENNRDELSSLLVFEDQIIIPETRSDSLFMAGLSSFVNAELDARAGTSQLISLQASVRLRRHTSSNLNK